MRIASLLAIALAPTAALAAESFQWTDDFARYAAGSEGAPNWDTTGIDWEAAGGKFVAADTARSFAILTKAPFARRVAVEATLVLRKTTGREWKTAGVAIVTDERNYWHLALVEAPDNAKHKRGHYVELSEMLEGAWLAHIPLTRLESLGSDLAWQYGHPYRLRIDLGVGEIAGTVAEPDGRVVARIRYKLDKRAVTSGRPALTCGGFEGTFDDVAAACSQPVPAPEQRKPTFPPYTQAGRVPLAAEPQGKATGFFHVEESDGRWWVIDPKGRPFFIVGTDHANYRVHWCEKLGHAPYHRAMVEQFGDEAKWAASTAERLLAWGFNSLGANHSPSLRGRGLAWMGFASVGAGFASVSDLCPKVHWTGFPNVFHPKFPRYCEQRARQVCAPHRDDPWLIGYFLDNELEWYGKEHREWSLVDEVFKKPADHTGKQALVAFLRQRYPAVERLNAAWGTAAASYDAIARSTEPLRHTTEQGRKDKLDFLRVIAEKYFSIAAAAIRRHDPNHMLLGCRFAGGFPPIGDIAGRHSDIFTINCYRWVDLATGIVRDFEADLARWQATVRRPFMITEWSFPALDSGLPCRHGAGQRFDTQDQKAQAFTIFQRLLFATPFMVGSNYFMWVDEPALGISSTFPEDSNYGLVNVRNEPYKPLVEAATRLHPQVYTLHSGRVPELSVRIEERPLRAVVANAGRAAAKAQLEVVVNGTRTRTPIQMAAGGSIDVPIAPQAKAVSGLVRVAVDPDGALPEVKRADNAAWRVIAGPAGPRPRIHVANPGRDAMPQAMVAVPLKQVLPDSKRPPAVAVFEVSASTPARPAARRRLLAQLDALADGSEVAFTINQLHPLTARFAEARAVGEAPRAVAPVKLHHDAGRWSIDNGPLRLVKDQPSGAAFDRVVLADKELGRFAPVIWQNAGQDIWPQPDTAKVVGASNGPVRLVLDVEFELEAASKQAVKTTVDDEGRYAAVRGGPAAFRTRYRFIICPGKPWFGARFLWLENTDTRPWDFQAYFHYATSKLAGDAANDAVGGADVPNYYRRDRAVLWTDAEAALHYGIAQTRPGDFEMMFWTDPGGGQHADVRRSVKRRLKPGERFTGDEPIAWVFGAQGPPDQRPWAAVAADIARWAGAVVRVTPSHRPR